MFAAQRASAGWQQAVQHTQQAALAAAVAAHQRNTLADANMQVDVGQGGLAAETQANTMQLDQRLRHGVAIGAKRTNPFMQRRRTAPTSPHLRPVRARHATPQ